MDLRAVQRPLKELYRSDAGSSRVMLTARAGEMASPLSCSVDIGRAIYQAEAHSGVGGAGTGACSGDLLLGALAACAQITCQMVMAALRIPVDSTEVVVEGDLDLRGTLGMSDEVPVGFQSIRTVLEISAPRATERQISMLRAKTEQYCVVFQTLAQTPLLETEWREQEMPAR